MKKLWERIVNGVIRENPTFVLMLGMCATLAVTSTAVNGLGMGLSTAAVLVLSNTMISLLRRVIPSGVRMPMKPPPPMPHEYGSTTPSTGFV